MSLVQNVALLRVYLLPLSLNFSAQIHRREFKFSTKRETRPFHVVVVVVPRFKIVFARAVSVTVRSLASLFSGSYMMLRSWLANDP